MPNPTRQEILDAQLARQWAERNKTCEVSSPEIQAAANFILANTPTPSMAEVEWDDDKHYLAEAESEAYGLVIMLQKSKETGNILIIFRGELKDYLIWQKPNFLAPTGRRYTLTEVQE